MTNIAMREQQENGADKTVSSKGAMKLDPTFSDLIEWSN